MSALYKFDQQSFQEFLGNAFAVQHSGLDPQSLSAVIEIQQFVASEEFDLGLAMHMTADRALKVSNASGVAVALLEGNELVYCAGSGTAANEVGRRIPAVLNVGSGNKVRREILRVENAQTDPRIQAEVCRQFVANASLMLPIYENHVLIGVLQVLYSESHSFFDAEVRTYQLMLGVVEEAIARHHQPVDKEPLRTSFRETVDSQYIRSAENVARALAIVANATEHNGSRMRGSTSGNRSIAELQALWMRLRTDIAKRNRRLGIKSWRVGIAITAVILLTLDTWIAYRGHSARSTVGGAVQRPAELHAPAKLSSLNNNSTSVSDRTTGTAPSSRGFKRVRVGPNEVDYIAEDVTVRRFTTGPPRPTVQGGEKQVNFGNDVTVRYFSDTPTTVSPTPATSAGTQSTKHSTPASH